MENKSKNIIIIILSVLLFISVMFNVINIRPKMMMGSHMDNNMMQRNFQGHMNGYDMRENDRNNENNNMTERPNEETNQVQ